MNALRLLALSCALACAAAIAAPPLLQDAMRGPTTILDEAVPPRLANAVNDDQRRTRNYDMQPPIIPHRVDGYQVDRNFNKCLHCHARARTGFSQAVPVSVTHYIDRSGKVLAQISTRRYFCQQCHVAQEPVRPLVANTFEDVDTVLRKAAAAAPQR